MSVCAGGGVHLFVFFFFWSRVVKQSEQCVCECVYLCVCLCVYVCVSAGELSCSVCLCTSGHWSHFRLQSGFPQTQ